MLLALQVFAVGAQECPARIRIAFADQQVAPLLMGAGSEFARPPGLLVDWTHQALRKLGCLERTEFQRLPNARIRLLARPEVSQIDLVPGVAEGSPNADRLMLPAPPTGVGDDLSTGEVDFSLYARAADAAAWDGQRLALRPGQTVGVARDTMAQALAQERGWALELAASHESAFQKLLAGRSNYLLVYAPFMDARLRASPDIVKLQPPVLRKRYYMAASQDFYQREPAFVRRFWVEMCLQGNALRAKPLGCAAATLH